MLHTYGPILVAEAKGEDTGVTIDDLELEVSDASGGRKQVSATKMKMTIESEWDRQVTTYDGSCSTTVWEITDPEEYGYEEDDGTHEWKQCDDDASLLSPFSLFNVFYAPASLDVIVEQHGGKWFLSPTSTVLENTVGTLQGLDRDDARRIARSWSGEWWIYEPDEVWEACGVAKPSLDDSRKDAEAAYEQCMESLPEDYDGPWGPFGNLGFSDYDDDSYEPSPSDDCWGSGSKMPERAEIEACLADLVAAGEIDQYELDSYRCDAIFEAIDYEDLTDEEYEQQWDALEDDYGACMEAADDGESSGGGVTFGIGGPNAGTTATTEPSTTATTQPQATTTTKPPSTTKPPATTTTVPTATTSTTTP